MTPARFLVLCAAAFAAGCSSINTKEAFEPTARAVADAHGVAPAWPQSDADEQTRQKQVRALLETELTSTSAVKIALLNNPGLRATFENLRISQADVLRASRLSNPTISASVRWPEEKPRGPNSEFSLAIDLLDGLLIPLKKNFAKAELSQAQQRTTAAVFDLVTHVKSALYTLQAHELLRQRLTQILEVNEASADIAQRQYDAGNISKLDLLNQQTSATEARLELHRADAQIRSDREAINRLLGLWGADTDWTFNQVLEAAHPLNTGIDYETFAISHRLDLAVARSNVDLSRSALKLKTTTRWLPASVGVGVDTERESTGHRMTGPNLELSLPIFDQGQADIAALTAELNKADAEFRAAAINIRSEVREARDRVIALEATARYYQDVIVPQRRALLRETLLHYNAMQKSNYDLLLAKQQHLVAEREAIEALHEYWIARAELEHALGGTLPDAAIKE